MKNAIINNLILDTPILKKGEVIQELDFYRSVMEPVLYNPKYTGHLFSILPLKKSKVWIHYYKKGVLTHIGVYHGGEIKDANLHLLKLKANQLKELNIEEIKDVLFGFCEQQLAEVEHDDIFHLWLANKQREIINPEYDPTDILKSNKAIYENYLEAEPLTMTHLRTILATTIVGDGIDKENVNTLTCVQDRLPNAATVQDNMSWSDKIYDCQYLQEIMQENGEVVEYEQLGLF